MYYATKSEYFNMLEDWCITQKVWKPVWDWSNTSGINISSMKNVAFVWELAGMLAETEEIPTENTWAGAGYTHEAQHGCVQNITLIGSEAFPAATGTC